MKLYLLTQDEERGYDTFDSVVVAANSLEEAKLISPDTYRPWSGRSWAPNHNFVDAQYLGEATEGTGTGIILASFNAG